MEVEGLKVGRRQFEYETTKTLQAIDRKLDLLLKITVATTQKEVAMLNDVIAAVEEQTTVVNSVLTLVEGLNAKIAELVAAGTIDPAQVQALHDAIKSNTQRLADAVAENTPAEE